MKTKHAAERLYHLYHDLEQMGKLADMANREALDAVYVRARMNELERLRLAVVEQLRRGIEPLLERRAPPLERRIAELEQRVEALEQHKVISLDRRKAAEG